MYNVRAMCGCFRPSRRERRTMMDLKSVVLRRRAPQPGGSYPRRTVSGTRLFRIGGLLVIVGAVGFVLHVVLRSVLTAGVDPVVSAQAGLWVPVNALGALGAALVLLGLPAVYARMARQGGLPGLVGFTLIEVSWMFFGLFLSLYGALVLPWLADQAPRLVAASAPTPLGFVVAFALGLLAWLLGAVLLAVPFVRGPARARWVGYLLPASALWVLVGNFIVAPGGPASNLAVNLLSNLGPVLLLIGLGYLGFRAWTERARPGTSGRMPVANRAEKGPLSLGVSPGGCGKGSMRSRKHATFRGSKMGLQRWFYDGGHPNLMARLLDRGTAALY